MPGRNRETYRALDLEGLRVGGIVRLEFDWAGTDGRQEAFGKRNFGHDCWKIEGVARASP